MRWDGMGCDGMGCGDMRCDARRWDAMQFVIVCSCLLCVFCFVCIPFRKSMVLKIGPGISKDLEKSSAAT